MAGELPRRPAVVGQTLGHYRIAEKIGEGGMGEVYRARDERLERDVAIKLLPIARPCDETARKYFRKEAIALSKLNHPNIETIFEFDTDDGLDFIVTEYIPGEGLHQRLASGALPEKDILLFGLQLADALSTAHGQGIIHRDLKPSNLHITPDGRLKILDFGLAKFISPVSLDAVTASLSESMRFVGTLPYMAPEQVRGEKLDARTDIWGAGAVLYAMATGHRPFRAAGLQVTDQILHEAPAAPSSVNARISLALEAIILKCLDKEPDSRYQSAKELAVDLRRLGRHETPLLVLASHPAPRRRGHGRRTQIQSLAVLPVKNFSGESGQEFFADGMTDALIADLAQLKAVKVISRTSVMHYKKTKQTLPQIAQELGVDGVVEASVLRSAGRVRVTAQLIEAREDRHLWAHSYERDVTDVLALQSDLVQAIVAEIRVHVTPQEIKRLKMSRRVDPEVYDTALRGKATLEYATEEKQIRQAIKFFQKAVDGDPTYAPAWAGLGEALWYLAATGWEFVAPSEVRAKAIAAADKALELDPNLPDAHKARAVVAIDGEWDLARAQRELERALELRPGYAAAHSIYGEILTIPLARFDEARRHFDRSRELDPLSPWNGMDLVVWYLNQGQFETAFEEGQRARKTDPTLWLIPYHMGSAQLLLGEPGKAVPGLEAALALLGAHRPATLLSRLGLAYGLAGREADVLNILAELREASRQKYISPYDLAVVYSALGRMDEAFRLIDQALAQRTPSLVYHTALDPAALALRRDSRWELCIDRLRKLVRLPPQAEAGASSVNMSSNNDPFR